ncbi:MAG: T9SS type A sorting domain-containing protein [Ignavibacteriales bacterium]|nr:T9SS type A sorting domain-containing protein [Ignavibacteriales bacterium]
MAHFIYKIRLYFFYSFLIVGVHGTSTFINGQTTKPVSKIDKSYKVDEPLRLADYDELKRTGKISIPKFRSTPASILPSNDILKIGNVQINGGELLYPRDSTFTIVPFQGEIPPEYRNDDGFTLPIELQFQFDLYGQSDSIIYINNNGNISFGGGFSTYTSSGFPVSGFPMIAPFWADVDTRNPLSGLVYFKSEPHRFTVIWEDVGYYSSQADKRNTYEVIITDGNDPLIGTGANVCFSYGDMQWTTGSASGGTGGFGGSPATVGVNKGDGTNYALIGLFDQAGTAYDGPGGINDGVDYLDEQDYIFYVGQAGNNIPPIPTKFPPKNTITLQAGLSRTDSVLFLSPEASQITQTFLDTQGVPNFSYTVFNGNISKVRFTFSPSFNQTGTKFIKFIAVDNGVPPETTRKTITYNILPGPGFISGYKFNDKNGDGERDELEPGIPNWKIYVTGPESDSQMTDINGNYKFTNLDSGTYIVREKQESGWTQTFPEIPGTYEYLIELGVGITDANFGNTHYGSISGLKFDDANGNGNKDGGEEGIANWKIKISGTKDDSVLTNINGSYIFSNLFDGEYTISEVNQLGWTQTYPKNPETYSIVLAEGEVVTGKDFGNVRYGSISGTVYNDLNGNGSKEGGEGTLPNWMIYISGTKSDSQLTDAQGNFSFTQLVSGTYTVEENIKSGWILTSSPVSYSFTLGAGQNSTQKNFGNFQLGSIGGMKFFDENANHLFDDGESGLEGWTIELVKNNSVVKTTTTDESGNYILSDISAGTYTVREVGQNDWFQTFPNSSSYSLVIQSGTAHSGKNFGSVKLGIVRGVKFNDVDADSIRDDEEGVVANWMIYLTFDDEVIDSTTTGEDGKYKFEGLFPGTYQVSEKIEDGWVQTFPSSGIYTLEVSYGTNITDASFGNYHTSTIILRKEKDTDGSFVTTEDRTVIQWPLVVRKNNVVIASSNDTILTISNLDPGEYSISEYDSLYWNKLGHNLDSESIPDTSKNFTVNVQDGQVLEIDIVNHFLPDTTKYRTLKSIVALSGKPVKLKKLKTGGFPLPNVANVRDTLVKTNFGLVVGKAQTKDSLKYYGWLEWKKGGDLAKFFTSEHSGRSFAFDSFRVAGKPTKKKFIKGIKGDRKKHNNPLAAEVAVLKMNIIGSLRGVFPFGFSFLELRNPSSIFNGMTVQEIGDTLDYAFTYWQRSDLLQDSMRTNELTLLLKEINGAFYDSIDGQFDTIRLTPLTLRGMKSIYEVLFLRRTLKSQVLSNDYLISRNQQPESFTMLQNYPNPFNPTTTITFSLEKPAVVSLTIYNVLGQTVSSLLQNEHYEEGTYEIGFEGDKLVSGVYFYRLEVDGGKFSAVRKLILLK